MFEPKSVQRMELLLLNVLRWRLSAVTPCSYMRYFLSKINGYDQEPSSRLIFRSLQVVASTTKGERSLLFPLDFGSLNLNFAFALWVIWVMGFHFFLFVILVWKWLMVVVMCGQVLTSWSLGLQRLLLQLLFLFLDNFTQYTLTNCPSLLSSHTLKR